VRFIVFTTFSFLHFLPCTDLFVYILLSHAIYLLNFSGQLITLARNNVELAIGELAPLLARFALSLLPITFNLTPVHVLSFIMY